jgi:hypothetical protein
MDPQRRPTPEQSAAAEEPCDRSLRITVVTFVFFPSPLGH